MATSIGRVEPHSITVRLMRNMIDNIEHCICSLRRHNSAVAVAESGGLQLEGLKAHVQNHDLANTMRSSSQKSRTSPTNSSLRRSSVCQAVGAAKEKKNWRETSKPIKPGSTYPAKEFCSNCGLCDTYYIAHVKDACAFIGDGALAHEHCTCLCSGGAPTTCNLGFEHKFPFVNMFSTRFLSSVGLTFTVLVERAGQGLKDRDAESQQWS